MTMSYLLPSVSRHWPPTSGVLAMFFCGERRHVVWSVPRDRPDDGVELGRRDRLDDRPCCRRRRRCASSRRRRPRTARGRSRSAASTACPVAFCRRRRAPLPTCPVSDDLNGWLRRPPHLGGEIVAVLAERLDRRPGTAWPCRSRPTFGLKPCWLRLVPESGEVGRQHHAGDDVAVRLLEGGDLRGEVVGQVLVAAGIDELVAELVEHRREADLLVAPGVAVAVIGEQAADRLVGLRAAPTCW